jgi:hypothetical protein
MRDELLHFMQEHRMADNNQFSAGDVLALTHLSRLYNLMNATLDNEVRAQLRSVTGAAPQISNAGQIALRGYFLYAWPCPNVEWWCGVGYAVPNDGSGTYPVVRLQMEVSGTVRMPVRLAILDAFRAVAPRPGWAGTNLDRTRHTAAVYRDVTLCRFLLDDHVAAIKAHFLELLTELTDIRRLHPELPWGDVPTGSEHGT